MTPEQLDGTPEEFPHRQEAMGIYRALWATYTLTTDTETKKELEEAMDVEQCRICRGPGPLWQGFADSLPGFREFWARFDRECAEKIKKLFPQEG